MEKQGEGTLINSIQSFELELPPSCIEFCPAHPGYFLIGTYYLEKKEDTSLPDGKHGSPESGESTEETAAPQSRKGSVIVFRLQDNKFTRIQTVEQPSAILDLHFQQVEGRREICAVASSTGTITIFRCRPGESHASSPLTQISLCTVAAENELLTAFAWHPTIRDLLAFTTSAGEVRLVKLSPHLKTVSILSEGPVLSHTLEAWTVAFSPWAVDLGGGGDELSNKKTGVTVYSGGDDSLLRYSSWSVLDGKDDGDDFTEFSSLSNLLRIQGHEAGVVAILPLEVSLADGSNIVVTGSYDEKIRVFAIKPPEETYGVPVAKKLAEKGLGGGIWRLKLIDVQRWAAGTASVPPITAADAPRSIRILVSCMHAGAKIVEIRGGEGRDWQVEVLARFEEHASMNYGCDFQARGSLDGGKRLACVSTSFYDRLVCLWEF